MTPGAQIDGGARVPNPTAGDHAVAIVGLRKRFAEVTALDGIDLQVPRGQVFGLLGPNGAGKTTTVKVLLGLLAADDGHAHVLGHDVARDPAAVRRCVGYVPQELTSDKFMTGRENLMFFARLYHLSDPRTRTAAVLDLVGMADAADRLVKTYSGGMRKRLDLAAGLLHEPDLHILDEPTLGLDVAARERVWTYIRDIRTRGGTVLLCTNYMDEADRLCDDIAIIDHGRVVARGTPSELKDGLGGDVITLTAMAPADGPVPAWPEGLAAIDGVQAVSTDGTTATITVTAGGQVLPRLLEATSAAGCPIAEVNMLRPSLDAVFLHHTGRRIGAADAAGAHA